MHCAQPFFASTFLLCRLAALCCLCLCLAACGSWRISDLWAEKAEQSSQHKDTAHAEKDTAIAAAAAALQQAQLPPDLMAGYSPQSTEPAQQAELITYKTEFVCEEQPELATILQSISLLEKLKASPPDNLMGLEYRIKSDEDDALKILHSHGYYAGTVRREQDSSTLPVSIRLILEPGTVFTVGESSVHYTQELHNPKAPHSLDAFGLEQGAQADASAISDAVERVPQKLHTRGYPFAAIAQTAYAINPTSHELYADVLVDAGDLARMNVVRMEGSQSVDLVYFKRMRNWRMGQLWNDAVLESYKEVLTQQGIFRSVSISPVPAQGEQEVDEGGLSDARGRPQDAAAFPQAKAYDILVKVEDGPQKSVGGGIYFDSTRGVGGQAFWEHRNLFSQGESLRANLELWQDATDLSFKFKKPGFLTRNTALTADAWLKEERTDAFEQRAGYTDIGLLHSLHRYWHASVKTALEGGTLKDTTHTKKDYAMLGVPLSLRFDNTGSLLNARKGIRATLSVSPAVGQYGDSFSVMPTTFELQGFYPVVGKDRAVLALRGKVGTLWQDDAQAVPASVRYYAGGGGSVRGYGYHRLGPLDSKDDPQGGASFAETSAELRIKITDSIGIVPFVDGGGVYKDQYPDLNGDYWQWAAGLGFRYYTSIGPIRADVAMPMNPRSSDENTPSFYISIGQSF